MKKKQIRNRINSPKRVSTRKSILDPLRSKIKGHPTKRFESLQQFMSRIRRRQSKVKWKLLRGG